MGKSKEFVEGFIAALQLYAWMDNSKQLRVGIPGVLLSDAIVQIENEREVIPIDIIPVNIIKEPKPVSRIQDEKPEKKIND